MQAEQVQTINDSPDIIIRDIRITEPMIREYGDGTDEPLRYLHYDNKLAFGLQLEGIMEGRISEAADVSRLAQFYTSFNRAVRVGDSIEIQAWNRNENGGRKLRVNVLKNGEGEPCLESTMIYMPQLDGPEEELHGEPYTLTKDDLTKVQIGIAAPMDGNAYPLALGLASKPLVKLGMNGDLVKRLEKETPIYVKHRIEIYEAAQSLHVGDTVHFRPKILKQEKRDVTAQVECFIGIGRKVYKIEMDLKMIPRKVLQAVLTR